MAFPHWTGLLFLSVAFLGRMLAAETAADPGLQFLEDRVKSDPDDFIAQNQIAERALAKLLRTGRLEWLDRASAAAAASLRAGGAPLNSAGFLLSARVANAHHRFTDARRFAEQFRELRPAQLVGAQTLFDTTLESGDYAAAAALVAEMQAADPDSLSTASRQARLAWVQGKTDTAAKAWDAAITWARTDSRSTPELLAWAVTQRGELAFRLGQLDAAQAAYDEAAQLLPDDWGGKEHRAELHAARGEYDPALDLLRAVIATTGRPELEQAAGDVAKAAGKLDVAKEFHDRAEAAYRASIDRGETLYIHHLAGFLCDVRPDPAEAVRLARRDLEQRQSIQAYDALAWALSLAGQHAEAEAAAAKALATGTRDAHILYHAGLISMSAGQLARGRELIRAASEANPRHQSFHFHR